MQITLTIQNADAPDIAATYGVTTIAGFKAVLLAEIKSRTKEHRYQQQLKAIPPSAEPDIT